MIRAQREERTFESHKDWCAYLLLVRKKAPASIAKPRLESASSNVMDGAENIRSLETRQATGCALQQGARQETPDNTTTGVGGWFTASLHTGEAGIHVFSSCLSPRGARGETTKTRGVGGSLCRQDLNYPPTAVGGISRSTYTPTRRGADHFRRKREHQSLIRDLRALRDDSSYNALARCRFQRRRGDSCHSNDTEVVTKQ